jgi:UDP-glucose 4-epimerase
MCGLEEILQHRATVEYQPPRQGDVRNSLADITRARELLGYQPTVDVKSGLKKTVEFFCETPLDFNAQLPG